MGCASSSTSSQTSAATAGAASVRGQDKKSSTMTSNIFFRVKDAWSAPTASRHLSQAQNKVLVVGATGRFSVDMDREPIGYGRCARVLKARRLEGHSSVAVKMMECDYEHLFAWETTVLNRLPPHPNLIQMFDSVRHKKHGYIFMEMCRGGSLQERIERPVARLGEKKARTVFVQLCSVVQHMHEHNILHRDIKPDNILFKKRGSDSIRLVDFGIASPRDDEDACCTQHGTLAFMAPELHTGNAASTASDVWAIGVCLFYMLCGYLPFDPYTDRTEMEIVEAIRTFRFDFDDPNWQGVSSLAISLIRKMLLPAAQRITLPNVLREPWLQSLGLRSFERRDTKWAKLHVYRPSELESDDESSESDDGELTEQQAAKYQIARYRNSLNTTDHSLDRSAGSSRGSKMTIGADLQPSHSVYSHRSSSLRMRGSGPMMAEKYSSSPSATSPAASINEPVIYRPLHRPSLCAVGEATSERDRALSHDS